MATGRILAVALLLLLGSSAAVADDGPPDHRQTPAGAPDFAVVESIKPEGVIECTYFMFKPVYETKSKNVVERDGRVKTYTYTTMRMVAEQRMMTCDLEEAQVVDRDGKALGKKDIQQRLKKGSPVLIVKNGQGLDDYYRQFVDKDILVLVLKSQVRVAPAVEIAPGAPEDAAPLPPAPSADPSA